MEFIADWFNQYGYCVLFFGLAFEYIGFPFPGELVMSYAGFLTYQGSLNWFICFLLSFTGTVLGMSFTFWFGRRVGYPFFEKYGSRFFMGPEKIEKTSRWFAKYGNAVIFFAYFVPGLRHFTGYFSGTFNIPFRTFALYAYGGALFWVFTFLTLGNRLGPNWTYIHEIGTSPLGKLFFAVLAAAAVFWVAWKLRQMLANLARQALARRVVLSREGRRLRLRWLFPTLAAIGMLATALAITSYIANISDF